MEDFVEYRPYISKKSHYWKLVISSVSAAASFLLPSFLRHNRVSLKHERPTAYLDGLKGLFAVIVFIRHYATPWVELIDLEFNRHHQLRMFQLPIIRIFYGGPTIPVFFAVSGYVLSIKPVVLLNDGSWDKLHSSFASSIFQRGMKIFGPPIVSTLVVVFLVQLNLYSFEYDAMLGAIPPHPERLPNLALQLKDWFEVILSQLTNVWTWEYQKINYDSHLWTIPIQYLCSIILYAVLIGLSRLKFQYRTAFSVVFAIYSMWIERWEVFVYIMGMVMCEVDYHAKERRLPRYRAPKSHTSWIQHLASETLWILLFIFALYIGSFPRYPTQGMHFFSTLYILSKRYTTWHSYGAVLMVFTVPRSRLLKAIFTNSVFLYLGEISFAIYLVHGPLLHIVGYNLVFRVRRWMQEVSTNGLELGLAIGFLLLFPLVGWAADLFKRTIQKTCIYISEIVKTICWIG